jgi:hypothetical protein
MVYHPIRVMMLSIIYRDFIVASQQAGEVLVFPAQCLARGCERIALGHGLSLECRGLPE